MPKSKSRGVDPIVERMWIWRCRSSNQLCRNVYGEHTDKLPEFFDTKAEMLRENFNPLYVEPVRVLVTITIAQPKRRGKS